MKIIAIGDIHMATSSLTELEGISTADLVIITGDITNLGERSEAKTVLNQVLKYNKNILCLAGNLDNSDVNDYLEGLGMNLHGQAHMVKRKVCIYGVGGSNKTPFATPWEFTEEELYRLILEAHHQAQELIDLAEPMVGYSVPAIFISHAPPINCKLDIQHDGKHVGSKAVRQYIEGNGPELCITGHIHESRGEDRIGNTHVINPGMFADGGWVEININKNTLQAILH